MGWFNSKDELKLFVKFFRTVFPLAGNSLWEDKKRHKAK